MTNLQLMGFTQSQIDAIVLFSDYHGLDYDYVGQQVLKTITSDQRRPILDIEYLRKTLSA